MDKRLLFIEIELRQKAIDELRSDWVSSRLDIIDKNSRYSILFSEFEITHRCCLDVWSD